MLNIIKNYVGEAAAPFIFLILFLVVGGAALWLTPRLAAWWEKRSGAHQGYYDGMLTEQPADAAKAEENEQAPSSPTAEREKQEQGETHV